MHQLLGAVVADIVEPVGRAAAPRLGRAVIFRRMVEAADHAADDVVYIGEVALHPAVVEDGDRLAREDFRGEDPHRHVGAAPRPVNRKKTKTCGS